MSLLVSSTFAGVSPKNRRRVVRYASTIPNSVAKASFLLAAYCKAHLTLPVRWQVVDICLSELGRSHYFVNFLGLRGGWRPTKAQVTKPTFNKFPFLTSYCPGRSVTEFEVLYGALGWGPKSVVHPRSAFFYMRDDVYVEKLPKEERVHFKEQAARCRHPLATALERLTCR